MSDEIVEGPQKYTIKVGAKDVSILKVDGVEYLVSNSAPAYLQMSKYGAEQKIAEYLENKRITRYAILGNAKYLRRSDLDMIKKEIWSAKPVD